MRNKKKDAAHDDVDVESLSLSPFPSFSLVLLQETKTTKCSQNFFEKNKNTDEDEE